MSKATLVASLGLSVATLLIQILPILSVPTVSGVSLGSYGDTKFGVLGYCTSQKCSPLALGFDTNTLASFPDTQISASLRSQLSPLLVLHFIAFVFSLVHLVSISIIVADTKFRLPQSLLFVSIWSILTLVLSIIASSIDIVLFMPHLDWCSWLQIAACVFAVSTVVLNFTSRRHVLEVSKDREVTNSDTTAFFESLDMYSTNTHFASNPFTAKNTPEFSIATSFSQLNDAKVQEYKLSKSYSITLSDADSETTLKDEDYEIKRVTLSESSRFSTYPKIRLEDIRDDESSLCQVMRSSDILGLQEPNLDLSLAEIVQAMKAFEVYDPEMRLDLEKETDSVIRVSYIKPLVPASKKVSMPEIIESLQSPSSERFSEKSSKKSLEIPYRSSKRVLAQY